MRNAVSSLLLAIFVGGCAEPSAPPADMLKVYDGTDLHLLSGDAPDGVPPEFRFPTILYSVVATPGFQWDYAYTETDVKYFATNVLGRATVTTSVGSATAERQTSSLVPENGEFGTFANIYMGSCAGSVRGDAYGKVWNEFLLPWTVVRWGDKAGSDSKTIECPSPPPGDGDSGSSGSGGGGGGASPTCHTEQIDHYWYYPDTGDVEYRYTETIKVCEGEI